MGLSPGQETKIPCAGVKKKNCVWQGYSTQKLTQISLISKHHKKIRRKKKNKRYLQWNQKCKLSRKKSFKKNPLCEKVQNLTEDNKDQNR